ncbi:MULTISPECIES: hypothetical protein [Bacillaceae]|uniref:Sodium:proton antiporter n=2 Tax=Bacillus infantis TaxID=324767 RepID=U5LFN7_9BACI|nr:MULTISPECIES: hypothetical protein [Bacillus]OXT19119.1 hypothetical protein B9K06_01810 [Bacillus sp. OG2]AGX05511.1 hypothetical protein N288_18145 [Bacillus infantis NRRL B-14911]EAR65157.1 hypothetical protein B14911_07895 [Bacillus sp. NRRL B-14911]MCA1036222.1 hypothetical protein [Bacillus infantis]MCK6204432.1 hypothetical protein [Bacillus infantis]
MSRIISILAIGIGGYYLYQNRFRVVNTVLGSSVLRRLFVTSLMNVPGVRNKMMKSVFSGNTGW